MDGDPKPRGAAAMSPEQRSLYGRMGAATLHARGLTNTGPAKRASDQRFLDQVDPEGILKPEERQKRASHAKTAWMLHLSHLSAQSRTARSRRGASR